MPLYMSQLAYTSEAWAAQVKHPANRIETIGRAAVEAAGGKVLGTWLCFGEYDIVSILDMPNEESMAALAIAITAGGSCKASKTTQLMTGATGVEALKKADAVAKIYKPAK